MSVVYNGAMSEGTITASIGIFAHNEEKYIGAAIDSVLNQKLSVAKLDKIVVISSGSTDETNNIVRKHLRSNKKIELIIQPRRMGKAAAINAFIDHIDADVAVTMSGDLKLKQGSLEALLTPFLTESVGMVGGRPKPVNSRFSVIGKEMELLWELHHRISKIKPKCGELVAFRNVIQKIPRNTAVDEATLEVLLTMIGYQVVYAPRAVVYNRVPLTVSDFMVQRRRIYAGHQWLANHYQYHVVSMQFGALVSVLIDYLLERPYDWWPIMRLVFLEMIARLLAVIDYKLLGKNPYRWKMIGR